MAVSTASSGEHLDSVHAALYSRQNHLALVRLVAAGGMAQVEHLAHIALRPIAAVDQNVAHHNLPGAVRNSPQPAPIGVVLS